MMYAANEAGCGLASNERGANMVVTGATRMSKTPAAVIINSARLPWEEDKVKSARIGTWNQLRTADYNGQYPAVFNSGLVFSLPGEQFMDHIHANA